MRVVTFDALHGRSLSDGLVDPARVQAEIAGLEADALAAEAMGGEAACRYLPA